MKPFSYFLYGSFYPKNVGLCPDILSVKVFTPTQYEVKIVLNKTTEISKNLNCYKKLKLLSILYSTFYQTF